MHIEVEQMRLLCLPKPAASNNMTPRSIAKKNGTNANKHKISTPLIIVAKNIASILPTVHLGRRKNLSPVRWPNTQVRTRLIAKFH